MHTLCSLALLALAACSKTSGDPPKAAPSPPPAAPKSAGGAASPGEPRAPGAIDSDDAFRAAATTLAGSTGLTVTAWGTAELDDVAGPDRFAQLVPTDAPGGAIPDAMGYLIHAGGALRWIRASWDGRTKAWMDRSVPPTWTTTADPFIAHQQGHRGGFEEHHLAIRAGEVVILRKAEQEAGQDMPDSTEFADGMGRCAAPCPKAAAHGFTVIAAATIAELVAAAKR